MATSTDDNEADGNSGKYKVEIIWRRGTRKAGNKSMETEALLSGFCKRQNQTRTVFCEYEVTEDGRRTLLEADCDYGRCEHSRDCKLMAQGGWLQP